MPQANIHPDLDPKKALNLTIRPWNIQLYRWFMGPLVPKTPWPADIETTTKTINNIELQIHRSKTKPAPGVLLWMHGGGLIIGKPEYDAINCAHYANTLGITVVALKYRLAPQHRFPAAIDDCMAAWQGIVAHAEELGIDPKRIVIGGASAGGGLAANLALRIRDEGGVQPVGQLLIYPMLDDRTTLRTDIGKKEHLVWNNLSNITAWNSYLGKKRGGESLPPYAAAGRHEDLTGLPPTWIGVGSLDLFYDEDVLFAKRLEDTGITTTLEVVEGGYHCFDALDNESSVTRGFFFSKINFLRPLLAN